MRFTALKNGFPSREACGGISGESIMIYPPGIPLVIPGGRITEKEIIRPFIISTRKQNCIIMNDDGNISTLLRSLENRAFWALLSKSPKRGLNNWLIYGSQNTIPKMYAFQLKSGRFGPNKQRFQRIDFFRNLQPLGTFLPPMVS